VYVRLDDLRDRFRLHVLFCTEILCNPVVSHACYLPLPFNPFSFDHIEYVWQEIQVMKLLVMLLSADFKRSAELMH